MSVSDEIIICADFQALHFAVAIGFGGEHDDRHVAGLFVGFQNAAKLVAVAFGHHHVADDQIRNDLQSLLHAVNAVHRFHHFESRFEILPDVLPHVAVVFDDENEGFILSCWMLDAGCLMFDAGCWILDA